MPGLSVVPALSGIEGTVKRLITPAYTVLRCGDLRRLARPCFSGILGGKRLVSHSAEPRQIVRDQR